MTSECSTDTLDHIDIDKIADLWSLINTRNVSIRFFFLVFRGGSSIPAHLR